MAASMRNLSVLCYAQGFTLWIYKTKDDLAQVGAPGYFSDFPAPCLFTEGDMVLVSAPGAGALMLVAATDLAVILLPMSSSDSEEPEVFAEGAWSMTTSSHVICAQIVPPRHVLIGRPGDDISIPSPGVLVGQRTLGGSVIGCDVRLPLGITLPIFPAWIKEILT